MSIWLSVFVQENKADEGSQQAPDDGKFAMTSSNRRDAENTDAHPPSGKLAPSKAVSNTETTLVGMRLEIVLFLTSPVLLIHEGSPGSLESIPRRDYARMQPRNCANPVTSATSAISAEIAAEIDTYLDANEFIPGTKPVNQWSK
ncbi:MAG: hypothetical protein O7G86_01615 [Gammaproteobacteria bacterium]|nr:hypothetical protein [Gammaproteobacteria bacterium]